MADLIAKVTGRRDRRPADRRTTAALQRHAGAVQIDGYDSYPQGFNCANPSTFGTPGSFSPFAGEPLMLPEFQGGSYDAWGGVGL